MKNMIILLIAMAISLSAQSAFDDDSSSGLAVQTPAVEKTVEEVPVQTDMVVPEAEVPETPQAEIPQAAAPVPVVIPEAAVPVPAVEVPVQTDMAVPEAEVQEIPQPEIPQAAAPVPVVTPEAAVPVPAVPVPAVEKTVEEVPVQTDVAVPEIPQAEIPQAVVPVPVVIDETARIKGFIESIFDGKNVKPEDIITGDDPDVKGYIQSIQSAPFYDKLLCFEVVNDEEKSIRLILYNTESQFIVHISAIDDYDNKIKMTPYPVKEQKVSWHPNKNVFIFQSNGYENREQLYMVEILDQYLMEETPVKITRIDFDEPKKTINHVRHGDFNSTGDDLYFTVRIQKEEKNEKYNKSNNIAVVKDIFKYKDSGFSKVKYELVFNKKFDQVKPVCSPSDPNMIAFISHNKDVKEGFGYTDYDLVVYNTKSKGTVVVDKMSGFKDYPCQWAPSGEKLFYCKALPLSKTTQKFRDQRINTINLQVAHIGIKADKLVAEIQKNSNSEIVLGDVATKENGIGFVGDDLVLMAKFDPFESVFLVDMNKWRNNDGFYIKQLPIDRDNDFPVITADSFIYMRYDYYKNGAVVSTVAKIPYEPKIDEEAAKAKAERRAKKKAKRNKDAGDEVQTEPTPPVEEVPAGE